MARAQEMPELAIGYPEPIYIHIGGSALVYELDEPVGMIGWPVHGLEGIPGIRRLYLENFVRYTFVRYGVPYVVAIECSDAGLRIRRMSCRDADKVAVRFIKALHVAGGTPQNKPEAVQAATIDRPPEQSEVFTYHSPGDIIPGTGFRRKGGVADYTVYSRMRFPIAEAPAFANSQSFMNWGNCEATGRTGAGKLDGVSAYRCRVSGQTLIADESARANYSYPWRDNFCEHRNFYVGQCPSGLGHQGQDIRPASCKQRIQGANRCEPYLHDVVAVRDGAVLRAPRQEALYIVVNAPNERIRVRYLHMLPPAIRRRRDAERPSRARRRGHRQGREFLQARARHHLSPALRPAGSDPIRLGIRQSLHDVGGILRAADPSPRPGDQGAGYPRGCAHRVHPPPAGSGALPRDRAGRGRKADRNGGSIARARDHPSEDSAR